MATHVLQLVDEADAVLFDCNDASGEANPYGLKTFLVSSGFNLSAPDKDLQFWDYPSLPGGALLRKKEKLTEASWRQRVEASSIGDLLAGVGRMFALLDAGARLKWQPFGMPEARYIEYVASMMEGLLRGQDLATIKILDQLKDPDGIPVVVWRQPYLASTELDPATNVLLNPLLLWGADPPTSWAWDSVVGISGAGVDAAKEAYKFIAATVAVRSLRQTVTGAAPGELWTGSFHLTSTDSAIARARAVLEFLDNADAVLATATGALVSPGTREVRASVTSAAAPANTAKVRISLQIENASAGAVTIYYRKAQLEKAATASRFRVGRQTVQNDPALSNGRAMPIWIEGDAPTPLTIISRAEVGANLQRILVGRRSSGRLQGVNRLADFLNRKHFQCESGTLSNDTSSVADAQGSGGNVAQTSYATEPTAMNKRVRVVASTLLDSLRGEWDVYVRLKVTAAGQHTISPRWSPSLADPAVFTLPDVLLDLTDATSFGYFDKKLGRIFIPTDVSLAGLAFELWSRRDSGAGSLNWDFITLVPVEMAMRVDTFVPDSIGQGSETWLGKELLAPTTPAGLTGGTVKNSNLELNAVNEAGGAPPNAGGAWPVGHHKVKFHVKNAVKKGEQLTYRVWNITDNVVAVSLGPKAVKVGASQTEIEFDSVAGKRYQPQVVMNTTGSDKVEITKITHSFVYVVTGAGAVLEGVRMDGNRQAVEKVDTADNLVTPLSSAGPLLWAEPGLNLLYFLFGDKPLAMNLDPESVLARAPAVSVRYAPRYVT